MCSSIEDSFAAELEPVYARFAAGSGYVLPGLAHCAVAA
jgi:hypothetical protein